MYNCDSLQWSDIYKISDPTIDQEHQKIFEIANKFTTFSDNSDKVKELIEELLNYTKYHFNNEEDYMLSLDYPLIKEHKVLHAKLIKELNDFLHNINDFEIDEIAKKLHYFIKTKVATHILTEDKKLLHFVQNKSKLKEEFTWKSIYNIGNTLIDTEHKKLFAIANKALNYSYYNNMQKHLRQTVKELYEYMKKHFAHEERYMQKVNYPKLEEHKILHENIIISLNEFIKQLPQMTPKEFEKKLIQYIDIGFVNHIIVEDNKIACFVEKKKHLS